MRATTVASRGGVRGRVVLRGGDEGWPGTPGWRGGLRRSGRPHAGNGRPAAWSIVGLSHAAAATVGPGHRLTQWATSIQRPHTGNRRPAAWSIVGLSHTAATTVGPGHRLTQWATSIQQPHTGNRRPAAWSIVGLSHTAATTVGPGHRLTQWAT